MNNFKKTLVGLIAGVSLFASTTDANAGIFDNWKKTTTQQEYVINGDTINVTEVSRNNKVKDYTINVHRKDGSIVEYQDRNNNGFADNVIIKTHKDAKPIHVPGISGDYSHLKNVNSVALQNQYKTRLAQIANYDQLATQ